VISKIGELDREIESAPRPIDVAGKGLVRRETVNLVRT
jgi:hypothetical protein